MHTRTLFVLAIFATAVALDAGAIEVKVEIAGIEEAKGQVLVAVYDKAESWLKRAPFYGRAEVKGNAVSVKVGDLPEGDYAFSIFHDLNGNNKMDSNVLGVPTEPYGFSNNAIGNFGPPSFEAAKVKINAQNARVDIKLN